MSQQLRSEDCNDVGTYGCRNEDIFERRPKDVEETFVPNATHADDPPWKIVSATNT